MQESSKEEQSIVEIEDMLKEKEVQLVKEKDSGNQSAQFKAQMKTHVERVDAATIKRINKIFEDANPEALSKMLEVFVALLRNNANSKPVDVELFFKDHAKLVSKMSKHDSTYCSLPLVEASFAKLNEMRGNFAPSQANDPNDVSFAVCFLDWSISFCEAAKIDLKLQKLQQDVVDAKLSLERAKLKLERFQRIKQDTDNLGFAGFFDSTVASLEDRIQVMDSICQTDLDQATQYQRKYKNFENAYFEHFMNIVQEQANDQ